MPVASAIRYLTPPEIARSRGVNVRKILGAIEAGHLKAVNYGTATRPRWKVPPEALAAFEAGRTSAPQSQAPAAVRRRGRETPKRVIQLI